MWDWIVNILFVVLHPGESGKYGAAPYCYAQ